MNKQEFRLFNKYFKDIKFDILDCIFDYFDDDKGYKVIDLETTKLIYNSINNSNSDYIRKLFFDIYNQGANQANLWALKNLIEYDNVKKLYLKQSSNILEFDDYINSLINVNLIKNIVYYYVTK